MKLSLKFLLISLVFLASCHENESISPEEIQQDIIDPADPNFVGLVGETLLLRDLVLPEYIESESSKNDLEQCFLRFPSEHSLMDFIDNNDDLDAVLGKAHTLLMSLLRGNSSSNAQRNEGARKLLIKDMLYEIIKDEIVGNFKFNQVGIKNSDSKSYCDYVLMHVNDHLTRIITEIVTVSSNTPAPSK